MANRTGTKPAQPLELRGLHLIVPFTTFTVLYIFLGAIVVYLL